MKKVVIYPGRFQPMLSHHAEVFSALQQQFPDAEVYIGTSDKVDPPKSPFSFVEKQNIARALGIDDQRVLEAKRPYHKDDYTQYFDEEETIIFFAVGEKDALERFPMNNVDQATGLDMRVRGEPGPKYYQMINTYKQDPKAMSERGYITVAPSIVVDDEVASASAFRQALSNSPDRESAREVFNKQFANYDEGVFNLIYDKITGAEMTEELNILRKLAGMDILEDAPVQFDTEVDPSKVKFMDASKNSAKLSIANRFPEGSDINDPEDIQEEFIKALIKSPAALLGEINERIDPKDENSLAVGEKLNLILDGMSGYDAPNIGNLPDEEKKFVISLVKVAIKDMKLVAGDDSDPVYTSDDDVDKPDLSDLGKLQHPSDPDEDDYEIEGVDLSDIRKEYNIEEDDVEEGRVKAMAMDMVDDFYNEVSKLVDQNNDIEKSIIQAWEDAGHETPPAYMLDDETQEILIDAGLIEREREEPEGAENPDYEGRDPDEIAFVDPEFGQEQTEELDPKTATKKQIRQADIKGEIGSPSKYSEGDMVVINGRHYILDKQDDDIWWASDEDGAEIEFHPGSEDHHEPSKLVDEGFMPEEMTGLVDYTFIGDDGNELEAQVQYRATIDQSEEAGYSAEVDPNSLQAVIDEISSQNSLARIDQDFADEMLQPGGAEHEEALKAAQEDAEEDIANADISPYDHGEGPAESVNPEIQRIKELAGIEELDEGDAWNWPDSYLSDEGYDANFNTWLGGVNSERGQERISHPSDPEYARRPENQNLSSEDQDAHKMFQSQMKRYGQNVEQQRKLSAKLKAEAQAREQKNWDQMMKNYKGNNPGLFQTQ